MLVKILLFWSILETLPLIISSFCYYFHWQALGTRSTKGLVCGTIWHLQCMCLNHLQWPLKLELGVWVLSLARWSKGLLHKLTQSSSTETTKQNCMSEILVMYPNCDSKWDLSYSSKSGVWKLLVITGTRSTLSKKSEMFILFKFSKIFFFFSFCIVTVT